MVEPIQGEGGLRTPSPHWLRALRELCDAQGMLLIFDEIQTGIGRTGRLFAHEWSRVTPDIMTIAKGIGGGFPLGACLSTREAGQYMTPGTHNTTFGGNPLATAVGNAVLDIVLAPGFLDDVNRTALLFKQKLAALKDRFPDVIEEIRGQGLLVGIKTRVPNTDLNAAARDAGLLTVPAGDNVLRLLPPLNISDADMDAGIAMLERACVAVSPAGAALHRAAS
jgi:acetylornithine/N-succinyldiaminopimelate aminotransferase